jgi:hypothetical protein
MNQIITLIAISFALSACGATPAAVDAVPGNARGDAPQTTEVEVTVNDSGLGTVVYDGTLRQPCQKQRRTGSHLYRVGCSAADSGSRPVKQGDWNSMGRYVVTGRTVPR